MIPRAERKSKRGAATFGRDLLGGDGDGATVNEVCVHSALVQQGGAEQGASAGCQNADLFRNAVPKDCR